jgi:hypothetical protein
MINMEMDTFYVLANYTPHEIYVELIDEPYQLGGVWLVAVMALDGQPFTDGAKTPTRTAYRTVRR